jgi:hypothetical protein
MHSEYRNKLNAPVQALVDEIETAAGGEIVVEHDAALGSDQMAGLNRTDGSFGPIIRFRERIAAATGIHAEPYAVFCHELLHLRRWLVDRVPLVTIEGLQRIDIATGERLDSGMYQQSRTCTDGELDSVLEHLVIEPQLTKYGFRTPDYRYLKDWWADPAMPSDCICPLVGRWVFMLKWVTTAFLADTGIQARATTVMARAGLLADGRQFSNELRWLLASPDPVRAKEGTMLAVCRALQTPPPSIRLWYVRADRRGYEDAGRLIPRDFAVPTATGSLARMGWNPKPHALAS